MCGQIEWSKKRRKKWHYAIKMSHFISPSMRSCTLQELTGAQVMVYWYFLTLIFQLCFRFLRWEGIGYWSGTIIILCSLWVRLEIPQDTREAFKIWLYFYIKHNKPCTRLEKKMIQLMPIDCCQIFSLNDVINLFYS